MVLSPNSPSSPLTSRTSLDAIGRAPGDALCPERFDLRALHKLRRQLGEYSFAALYQQRPTPLDGGLFKRKWLSNIVERLPPDVRLVRAYDLAVSQRTSADFTASVLAGFDPKGNLYIADVMRRRLEYPEQRRFVIEHLIREPRIQHGVELALHGNALLQDVRRHPAVRSTPLRGIRVEADKVTRALAWASLAEEGRIFLVRGPWLRDFVDEVSAFPNSKHDDQVDAVSLAIQMSSRPKTFRSAGF